MAFAAVSIVLARFGDRQGVPRPLRDAAPKVVLMFPVSNELKLLHVKMHDLDSVVDHYVISESCHTSAGDTKQYEVLDAIQHDARFAPYRHKVVPVKECSTLPTPVGWEVQNRVRAALPRGLAVINADIRRSVVVTSDCDEVPSAAALLWLKDKMAAGTDEATYEFRSTMPVFVYGFVWYAGLNYAMATARSMAREIQFWREHTRGTFQQVVRPIGVFPSGYHCTSCMSAKKLLLKWKRTNEDGESMADKYAGDVARVERLMALGLRANGRGALGPPPGNVLGVVPTHWNATYPELFRRWNSL